MRPILPITLLGAFEGEMLAQDGSYQRAIIGDFNGDGLDDLAMGAEASYIGRDEAGGVYVIFGKRGTKTVDLAKIGDAGIEIAGPEKGAALNSVAGAGDIDGDGLDDLIVGASGVDGPGTEGAGAAYVIRGREEPGVIDLAEPDAAFMTIYGAAEGDVDACEAVDEVAETPDPSAHCDDNAGWSVAGPGDVNGDDIPDVALDAGRPSVVFGDRDGGTVKLGELGDGGYRIEGVSYTTHSVAAAGDVNRDGLGDFTITDTENLYAAALVFGSRTARGFDYARPGDRALRLHAESIDPVNGVGDFNGDGRADLVAGGQVGNTGTAWVAFGPGPVDRMRLGAKGWRGVRLATRSERGGVQSPTADAVGDVNGDGRDDVFVEDHGAPFVLLGRPGSARLKVASLGSRALRIR